MDALFVDPVDPADKVANILSVENGAAHLKQRVRAFLAPAHMAVAFHALANHIVDGRLSTGAALVHGCCGSVGWLSHRRVQSPMPHKKNAKGRHHIPPEVAASMHQHSSPSSRRCFNSMPRSTPAYRSRRSRYSRKPGFHAPCSPITPAQNHPLHPSS